MPAEVTAEPVKSQLADLKKLLNQTSLGAPAYRAYSGLLDKLGTMNISQEEFTKIKDYFTKAVQQSTDIYRQHRKTNEIYNTMTAALPTISSPKMAVRFLGALSNPEGFQDVASHTQPQPRTSIPKPTASAANTSQTTQSVNETRQKIMSELQGFIYGNSFSDSTKKTIEDIVTFILTREGEIKRGAGQPSYRTFQITDNNSNIASLFGSGFSGNPVPSKLEELDTILHGPKCNLLFSLHYSPPVKAGEFNQNLTLTVFLSPETK